MIRIIGVDIGGTKCAVILAEIGSEIHLTDRITFPTFVGANPLGAVERIIDGISTLLKRHDLIPSQISAVGISCGGPLDCASGVILSPPNLPGWDHVPITRIIRQNFNIPVFLQNDANACALAEWQLGAGCNTQHMAFLTMGTGLGAGIILNGRLLEGTCGMAGEIGHIRIEEDGPEGYGKSGSLEGFASGGGISRLAKQEAQKAMNAGKPFAFASDEEQVEKLTTQLLAEYASKGDPDAAEIFSIAGEKLGKGLAVLIDVLNPECIVIGGVFGRCEELLRPSMEKSLAREALSVSRRTCRIVPAKTGEQIGDYGSIMAALYGMDMIGTVPLRQTKGTHIEELLQNHPTLSVCSDDMIQAFNLLKNCFMRGGKLLLCGNGGSAADCDHIVGELMKGFLLERKTPLLQEDEKVSAQDQQLLAQKLQQALPAVSLTAHQALFTAYANDVDAAMCFAQQVYGYGQPGDILLAVSTSGNSKNILYAAQTARLKRLHVIGLTGRSGGALATLSDVCIRVPSDVTARIQEFHLPVYHTLCAMLEDAFFGVDKD